jgi:hypothetical protein
MCITLAVVDIAPDLVLWVRSGVSSTATTEHPPAEATGVVEASQMARKLGLTGPMVRRYADVFETLTGDILKRRGRNRIFTVRHLEIFQITRSIIASNGSVTVEEAMNIALGNENNPTIVQDSILGDIQTAIMRMNIALDKNTTALNDIRQDMRLLQQNQMLLVDLLRLLTSQ